MKHRKPVALAQKLLHKLLKKDLLFLQAPIQRVTGYDTIVPYFQLEKNYLPSQKRKLLRAVTKFTGERMKIFYLPDLGEGLPEAEIREWSLHEGDEVKVDQPIASMETAKAVVEIPAPRSGRIIKLYG